MARICAELRERFEAFCRRDLYEVKLVVLFLDAIYLPVRPSGPKEGVMCAWGITEDGAPGAGSLCVWGRARPKRTGSSSAATSPTRGLAAPRLIVADGAPGLTLAIEETMAPR